MHNATDHPTLVLIAAVARNGAIGRDNELVWREPEDLRRLRALTIGHAVLMGRKTWDSLPERFRPLPGRRNLVLTRDRAWRAAGAEAVVSLDDALQRCAAGDTLFVLGGAQLYALALPRADRLELTELDADLDGDTHFPAWSREQYVETAREARRDARGMPYSFVTYQRREGT